MVPEASVLQTALIRGVSEPLIFMGLRTWAPLMVWVYAGGRCADSWKVKVAVALFMMKPVYQILLGREILTACALRIGR
jgi:hypothetical protein